MKHAFETLDCQLDQILAHVVHGDYSLDFRSRFAKEVLRTYWALDKDIKAREPTVHKDKVAAGSTDISPGMLGMLGHLLPRDGGGAA